MDSTSVNHSFTLSSFSPSQFRRFSLNLLTHCNNPSPELQNLVTGSLHIRSIPASTASRRQTLQLKQCTLLPTASLRVSRSTTVRTFEQSNAEQECDAGIEDGSSLEASERVREANVEVVVEKIGRNKRRVSAQVCIEAPIDAVWQVLTDYEELPNFLPSLVVCQLLERRENCARLLQIGEQNLALGLKFRAKGVLDVQENPVQISAQCICRDIAFEMVEGDFETFRGFWHLEQVKGPINGTLPDSIADINAQTTLSYILDVQPKIWLPVNLVETRLSNEIKINLASIRGRTLAILGSLSSTSSIEILQM